MWYGHHNQTVASLGSYLPWHLLGWSLIYLVLLWFVLTSRRKRGNTLIYGSIAVGSGALLCIGMTDFNWLTGESYVAGSYSRWTEMKHGHQEMLVPALLSVHIGLEQMNITFRSDKGRMQFYYNEHVDFVRRRRTERFQLNEALSRGVPNPILSVLDFILHNHCNFIFEQTGFLTRYVLTVCLVVWLVNQVIFTMVPEISAKVSFMNASVILATVINYMVTVDIKMFVIPVEGQKIQVSLGRAPFLVIMSAILQFIPSILVLFHLYPTTSFEVDFGTPWETKCIRTDQKDKSALFGAQQRKPQLKGEDNFGFLEELRRSTLPINSTTNLALKKELEETQENLTTEPLLNMSSSTTNTSVFNYHQVNHDLSDHEKYLSPSDQYFCKQYRQLGSLQPMASSTLAKVDLNPRRCLATADQVEFVTETPPFSFRDSCYRKKARFHAVSLGKRSISSACGEQNAPKASSSNTRHSKSSKSKRHSGRHRAKPIVDRREVKCHHPLNNSLTTPLKCEGSPVLSLYEWQKQNNLLR